jgi:hypothetical protein
MATRTSNNFPFVDAERQDALAFAYQVNQQCTRS